MSRNKGTTGQAHSLAMRRDEPGQSVNIQDGMRDNQYFSAKFCFRTPFLTLERAFPVFERPFLFSNVLSCARMSFWEIDFVLGRPGTDEFVPGFLLLPLSRDKGAAGQGNIFVPGHKGQWDVLSRGNLSCNHPSSNISTNDSTALQL